MANLLELLGIPYLLGKVKFKLLPSGKTNMAMENGPVEDVFPIEHGDFPASHVSLLEGISWTFGWVRD